jgi:hypothetical protein
VCAELLELQIDIEETAFTTGEIDVLIDGADPERGSEDDVPPPVRRDEIISREGDIWQLGPNTLMCGNALEARNYEALLGSEKADLVFTDPPYNIPIDGHVSGLGKIKHGDFLMASGEMSPEKFTAFLRTTCAHLANNSRCGSIHYICMDWRHLLEILNATTGLYELKNVCVWNKSNAGMGSLYRSKHEFVFVLQNGPGRFQNNVAYPGMSSIGKGRMEALAAHPTVKPLALGG